MEDERERADALTPEELGVAADDETIDELRLALNDLRAEDDKK